MEVTHRRLRGGRLSSGLVRRSSISNRSRLNTFGARFPGRFAGMSRFDREKFMTTSKHDPVVVRALYSRFPCPTGDPDRRVRQTTLHTRACFRSGALKCFGCFGRAFTSVGGRDGKSLLSCETTRANNTCTHQCKHATTAHPESQAERERP